MKRFRCVKDPQENFRIISVLNYGAFIAEVDLYYDYQGMHYNFSNSLAVLQEFRVNIPLNATNITLFVYADDLFRGRYLLFRNDYTTADDACFLLWGLSFAAQYKKIPCTSPGLAQSILPPAVCVPPQAIDLNCNSMNNCSYLKKNSISNKIKCYKNACGMKRFKVKCTNIYN